MGDIAFRAVLIILRERPSLLSGHGRNLRVPTKNSAKTHTCTKTYLIVLSPHPKAYVASMNGGGL